MSIALMTEVWKSALPMTEKMVLLCLADFANDRGQCWPSVETIAGKCSCSDRTVQKAIKRLRQWGILAVEEKPGRPHCFTITPRKYDTPEEYSPPKMSAKGVKNIRHGGEAGSPKPSKNHQEPSEVKSADADFSFSDFEESWNEVAARCGLPRIVKSTPRRRKAFSDRKREFPEIEHWRNAFRCLERTDWLHGKNDRGWRADPDFFLQPKSFPKLVEGSYGQAH